MSEIERDKDEPSPESSHDENDSQGIVDSVKWNAAVSELDFIDDTLAVQSTETTNAIEPVSTASNTEEEGVAEDLPTEIPNELKETSVAEFVSQDQLLSVVESLLFSTDKPVSVATIKTVFKGSNVRSKDILAALEQLASESAAPNRGVTLEEVNGGYQLRTKSDNAEFLRRLAKVRPFRLSGPALEVMSIVAYKQPVTKNEIDEIRGVESGHLLRALMERGLVYFAGKSELPGKPMTYGSTRKFLEIFGLRNIRELPTLSEIDELLPDGIGDVEEKESLSDITDTMAQTAVSSYSEGEAELEKINVQLKAVETSSEFFEQEKQRERQRRDHERAQEIRERIVLDDLVEEKDRKWLTKYEAKLLEPTPAQRDQVENVDGERSLVAQLEDLTDETAKVPTQISSELEQNDVDEILGEEDLSANPEWDEDSEHEI